MVSLFLPWFLLILMLFTKVHSFAPILAGRSVLFTTNTIPLHYKRLSGRVAAATGTTTDINADMKKVSSLNSLLTTQSLTNNLMLMFILASNKDIDSQFTSLEQIREVTMIATSALSQLQRVFSKLQHRRNGVTGGVDNLENAEHQAIALALSNAATVTDLYTQHLASLSQSTNAYDNEDKNASGLASGGTASTSSTTSAMEQQQRSMLSKALDLLIDSAQSLSEDVAGKATQLRMQMMQSLLPSQQEQKKQEHQQQLQAAAIVPQAGTTVASSAPSKVDSFSVGLPRTKLPSGNVRRELNDTTTAAAANVQQSNGARESTNMDETKTEAMEEGIVSRTIIDSNTLSPPSSPFSDFTPASPSRSGFVARKRGIDWDTVKQGSDIYEGMQHVIAKQRLAGYKSIVVPTSIYGSSTSNSGTSSSEGKASSKDDDSNKKDAPPIANSVDADTKFGTAFNGGFTIISPADAYSSSSSSSTPPLVDSPRDNKNINSDGVGFNYNSGDSKSRNVNVKSPSSQLSSRTYFSDAATNGYETTNFVAQQQRRNIETAALNAAANAAAASSAAAAGSTSGLQSGVGVTGLFKSTDDFIGGEAVANRALQQIEDVDDRSVESSGFIGRWWGRLRGS